MEPDALVRISTRHEHAGDVVVRVEGRLESDGSNELEGLLLVASRSSRITLDLSGLTNLDSHGRAVVQRAKAAGCRIVGASLYIHHVLEEHRP